MASKKKEEVIDTKKDIVEEKSVNKEKPKEKSVPAPGPKYNIGDIVLISKDADADLDGFKLFPQYKKYTYTVEAYDGQNGVYTLRRLNLSLRLKEAEILAPSERHGNMLAQTQY